MEHTHFEVAINALVTNWEELKQRNGTNQSDWQHVQLITDHNGGHFVRITRNAPQQNRQQSSPTTTNEHPEDGMLDYDDDESIPKFASSSTDSVATIPIIHDIVYSHTYQVPVLYILHRPPSSHQILTELYAPSIQAAGIMGGLTLVHHPETGTPVYFVHPCRTQEAVRDVLGPRRVEGVDWLMIWFGVIGNAVGLSVPVELARLVSDVAGND